MKPILILAILAILFTSCKKDAGLGDETAQYYVTDHCRPKHAGVYCTDATTKLETISGARLKAAEAGQKYIRQNTADVELYETFQKP